MRRIAVSILVGAAAIALAGCRQERAPAPTPDESAPAAASLPRATASAEPAAPSTARRYELDALQDGDHRGGATEVGGCTLTDSERRSVLVLGNPDDRTVPAIATARLDGRVVHPLAEAPGGVFDKPRIVLAFEGVRFVIERPSGPGKPVGIETTAWPATLTISDSDGRSRVYRGEWSCGV